MKPSMKPRLLLSPSFTAYAACYVLAASSVPMVSLSRTHKLALFLLLWNVPSFLQLYPTTTQPSSHSPRIVYKSSLVFPPQLFPISSLGIKVVLLSTDHKSYCTLIKTSKRLTSNQSVIQPSSLYQNIFKATPFFSKSLFSFSCFTLLFQLSPRGSPSSTIPSQALFSIRVVPQCVTVTGQPHDF